LGEKKSHEKGEKKVCLGRDIVHLKKKRNEHPYLKDGKLSRHWMRQTKNEKKSLFRTPVSRQSQKKRGKQALREKILLHGSTRPPFVIKGGEKSPMNHGLGGEKEQQKEVAVS